MPTKTASHKPKVTLNSQQIIALHVDLMATAFAQVSSVEVLPSGGVDIDKSATIEDLQTIVRFTQQEATISSTFRFYWEGDIWNLVQRHIGKRKGKAFLIGLFGEVLGRQLYWRYRFRGSIACLIPIYSRNYTMTQREILTSLDKMAQPGAPPEYSDVHIMFNSLGQGMFEVDIKNEHHSIPIPAAEVTKLMQSTLK